MKKISKAIASIATFLIFQGCTPEKIDESKVFKAKSEPSHWYVNNSHHRFLWDLNNDGRVDIVSRSARDNIRNPLGDHYVVAFDSNQIGSNEKYWRGKYTAFYSPKNTKNLTNTDIEYLTEIYHSEKKIEDLTKKILEKNKRL